MHVAIVTETYPPEVNGVAMTIERMVGGLRARGHRVSLTRPRQGANDVPQAATELRFNLVRGLPIPGYPGLKFGLPAPFLFRREWRRDRPDVVQIVTEGPLGASALRAARALRIPVVTEFHTNFHTYSRHYGFGWLEQVVERHLRRLHNRSDITLVPSHQLGIDLMRRGYDNIRVVARGVDTTLFNPARRSAALRASWGADNGSIVAAYVGRLAPEKNLNLLLATHAALKRYAPRTRLLLVGDGPSRRKLERAHAGHIFAGMRRGEDLAAHYASADLFIFPSMTETYGNVVLEAMASGLPVVAFRMAAAAELIQHGYNGMLAEPGDGGAFTRAALDTISRPGTRQRIAARAVENIAGFDWERIHDRLEWVLHEATLPRPGLAANDGRYRFMPD